VWTTVVKQTTLNLLFALPTGRALQTRGRVEPMTSSIWCLFEPPRRIHNEYAVGVVGLRDISLFAFGAVHGRAKSRFKLAVGGGDGPRPQTFEASRRFFDGDKVAHVWRPTTPIVGLGSHP